MAQILKNQVFSKEQRQKRNYLIHLLYVQHEFEECLLLIEDTLAQVNDQAEYPLYVKGHIMRQRGKITDSLILFQQAARINPHNVENLKQVGRSLFLLGKHKAALDYLEEALRMGHQEDWEIWHNKGLCLAYLRKFDDAKEALMRANSIQRHDCTFMQLGQILSQEEDYKGAIDVYLEALEFSPENPEMLTTIGLLYLRMGENFRAFDFLGNSLTHDPTNAKTILAAGSIIQDHSDMDVALIKYRVAAVKTPNSAQLWNNIGMCFFGKQRYIAAIACLKKVSRSAFARPWAPSFLHARPTASEKARTRLMGARACPVCYAACRLCIWILSSGSSAIISGSCTSTPATTPRLSTTSPPPSISSPTSPLPTCTWV
jgi:Bardet-Biedl syndrome 4 protein